MTEPTLRSLLRRTDLGLRLVSAEDALRRDALDRPLRWVHSSDLADPTPFLADELALLTTGTQFADGDEAGITAYVARLSERGVLGLGFGTEVHRAGIPDELVDACAEAGMPLFAVPYDTPFIAVARAHSEAIAAQAYARRTWALDTQRALAVAALRPRGLEETLTELSRRLGHWVGRFDASGALVHESPAQALTQAELGELSARAVDLITRGGQAGQSLTLGSDSFTLFTLGRSGRLRGVIAIGTAALDPEARAVVTSVIAMAGLALEQSEQLARAQARLRGQVLESLLLDDPTLGRRVLGSLPHAPMIVAVADASAPASAIERWWERRRGDHGTAAFVAEGADGLVICVSEADADALDDLAARFAIALGVSDPHGYSDFARAHAQALSARRHGGQGAVRYVDAVASSILSALATDDARLIAASRLAPLQDHPDLERTLRVWLEHDARIEQGATALGIHRHTLRTRIAQASALLGTDLSAFPARAELWAALQTVGR
ncbi:PucR family transcriptional regulator [Microbacterium sp. NPDC055903]